MRVYECAHRGRSLTHALCVQDSDRPLCLTFMDASEVILGNTVAVDPNGEPTAHTPKHFSACLKLLYPFYPPLTHTHVR